MQGNYEATYSAWCLPAETTDYIDPIQLALYSQSAINGQSILHAAMISSTVAIYYNDNIKLNVEGWGCALGLLTVIIHYVSC